MKKKFRRVRGGFVPRTPFYKKYRTAARTSNFRTAIPVLPRSQPMRVPAFRGISRSSGTMAETKTKPQLAPAKVNKKVSTDQEMARRRRRALRYLPALYKKKPRYPMMKRKNAGATRVKPTGEGATRSFYTNGRRLRKKLFGVSRLTPLQTRVYNSTARWTSISGRQAFWSYESLDNPNLDAIMNTMNYNVNFPISTRTLYLESVTLKYMLANTAASNVFVDIYNIEPRKDISDTPVNTWSLGLDDMATGQSAAILGTTPYMSMRFTKAYIIKKVTRIELAAGRTHLHTCKYNIGKAYSAVDDSLYGTDVFRKGYTHGLLFAAYSEPINNADVTPIVTTAPVSINVFASETQRFRYGDLETKDIFIANDVQANVLNLRLYDEGSGAVETFTAA